MADRSRRRESPAWFLVLRNLVIGFAILALVQGLLVRVFAIPSSSMMETLNPRDRVIVNLRAYDSAGPQRGDIVVFRHGDTWDDDRKPPSESVVVNAARDIGDFLGIRPSNYNYTVKRVIAVGGDTASCCDQAGHVTVNDEPLAEPYLYQDLPFEAGTLDCATEQRSLRCFGPIQVPDEACSCWATTVPTPPIRSRVAVGRPWARTAPSSSPPIKWWARSCSPCCHHAWFAEVRRIAASATRRQPLPRSLAVRLEQTAADQVVQKATDVRTDLIDRATDGHCQSCGYVVHTIGRQRPDDPAAALQDERVTIWQPHQVDDRGFLGPVVDDIGKTGRHQILHCCPPRLERRLAEERTSRPSSPAAVFACCRYSCAIWPDVGRCPRRWAIRFRLGTTSLIPILIFAATPGWALTRANQSRLNEEFPVESTFHRSYSRLSRWSSRRPVAAAQRHLRLQFLPRGFRLRPVVHRWRASTRC